MPSSSRFIVAACFAFLTSTGLASTGSTVRQIKVVNQCALPFLAVSLEPERC